MSITGSITPFGFDWGAAKVKRGFCDNKKGWVAILLDTPKVRICDARGEWMPPKEAK